MGTVLCSRCGSEDDFHTVEKAAVDFDAFVASKRAEAEQQAAFFASELTTYTARADKVVGALAASVATATDEFDIPSWENVARWVQVDIEGGYRTRMLNDSLTAIVGVEQETCRSEARERLHMWETDFTAPCSGFLICGDFGAAPVLMNACQASEGPLIPEMLVFRAVLPNGGTRVIVRAHAPVLRTPSCGKHQHQEWKFPLCAQQAPLRAGEKCIVSFVRDVAGSHLPPVLFVPFLV